MIATSQQQFPHLGQPSAAFLLDRDFFIRSLQLPFSFSRSAWGPGVAFFLEWFELFSVFFLFISFGKGVFVRQPLPLGRFHGEDCAFTIVQLPIMPKKSRTARDSDAMQIFSADIVIDKRSDRV